MNLFNILIESFNKAGLNYAIAGISDSYPENINSDIDIIISKKDIKLYWKIINQLKSININWVQKISHESHAHYSVITFFDGKKFVKICPDMCSDYMRKGKLFFRSHFLLQNRFLNEKKFYILSSKSEFIYYLLKKMDKREINLKQFQHIKKRWLEDRIGCLSNLKFFFSEKNISLLRKIFDNNDFSLFSKSIFNLRKDLNKNLNFKLDVFAFRVYNRISRILKPTGIIIAFLGPDGSGKTTAINGLINNLKPIFLKYNIYHLYPKKIRNSKPTVIPHSMKPRGLVGSLIKLIYFFLLYSFGFITKVYPNKLKSSLVIFDRYYHDLIIDPIRYRNGAGDFLTRLVSYFIPKPDIWFLLDANPKNIHSRKAEVSFEETSRQVIEYKNLMSQFNNGYIIDANQSPRNVIFDIEKIILEYMNKRTLNRNT